jgi:hypothetical protein
VDDADGRQTDSDEDHAMFGRPAGDLSGNVNRIKMIKRTMDGRANFDLLRTLVVLGP